jgi:ACS family tartrate transporter-like MFS transporter
VIFYFSQWFDKQAMSRVVGLFYAVIPLASALAAPISTLLLVSVGWQWLFVIEGIPAIVLSFVVLRLLPDKIEDAKFLTADQKLELRAAVPVDSSDVNNKGAVRKALKDKQTVLLACQYFLLALGNFAILLWLPQVIGAMGFDTLGSGLISAVPFALAAVAVPLWALHASRTNERYWHSLLPIFGAIVVFTIGALVTGNVAASLITLSLGVALSIMASASYWAVPRVIAVGAVAAASTAIANSVGNLAGFFGPTIAGFLVQATGSFQIVLTLLAVPLVGAAILGLIAGRMADPKTPTSPIRAESSAPATVK